MNLFQKLLAISGEITGVEKTLEVEQGGRTYNAVREADVLAAVKPLEQKYGIFSYPSARSSSFEVVTKEYVDHNGELRKGNLVLFTVETTYTFVNTDNPEEQISVTSFGQGVDSGDKAPGKAMTYADKYALIKAYKIAAGDAADPDATPSPEDGFVFGRSGYYDNPTPTPTTEPAPAQRSAPRPAPAPAPIKTDAERLAEAKGYIVPMGQHKGKSLGEVLALNKSSVEFYASDKFRGDRYPELKEAAKTIMELGK